VDSEVVFDGFTHYLSLRMGLEIIWRVDEVLEDDLW
jgi:hypothetical protein